MIGRETEKLKKRVDEVEEEKLNNNRKKKDMLEVQEKSMKEFKDENDRVKFELIDQLKTLELKNDQILGVIAQKTELEAKKQKLQTAIDLELKETMRKIADKEREKVEATDKLKNEMNTRIGETRSNLETLKNEQIQTTKRLTVLQNYQLSTELEYQSKQTEKLLNKNQVLQDQVVTLKREIEIHKEVEKQLADKAQKCQDKLKGLTENIKDLEMELSALSEEHKEAEEELKEAQENFARRGHLSPEDRKVPQ